VSERLLRLRCRGHPAIRATHDKTLELTADPSITARATCVVGVDAKLTAVPDGRLAGPVRVRISAGDHHAAIWAVANPYWRPGAPIVVRRSRNRMPDTLATEADLAAAALPRELVARLADPATEIDVVLERADRRPDGRAGLVLLWVPPDAPGPRLSAEADAADLVVAEDEPAAALVEAGAPARVAEVLAGGGRVLLVATGELPGASATAALRTPDAVAVEVAGLPVGYAAAAGSPRRAPVHVAGRLRQRDLRGALRAVPAASQLVVTVPAARLPDLLAAAERERGTSTAAVLAEPVWSREYVRWGPLADLADAGRGAADVVCCLDGTGAETGGYDADEALLAALVGQGVSGRTLALALAGLPGWSRRRAYEAVHHLELREQKP
jgi:hypothetical protein